MTFPYSCLSPDAQLARAKREGWAYDGSMATEGELVALFGAIAISTRPEVIVETGTYTGMGTEAFVKAIKHNRTGHLWTVESDDDLARQWAEKDPMDEVTFVHADSLEWARDEAPLNIDLCLVDCGEPPHRVEVARTLWWKMRPAGILMVHDLGFYSHEFRDELVKAMGPMSLEVSALNGLGIWQK